MNNETFLKPRFCHSIYRHFKHYLVRDYIIVLLSEMSILLKYYVKPCRQKQL